jgi:hypothetical protein
LGELAYSLRSHNVLSKDEVFRLRLVFGVEVAPCDPGIGGVSILPSSHDCLEGLKQNCFEGDVFADDVDCRGSVAYDVDCRGSVAYDVDCRGSVAYDVDGRGCI